MCVWTGLHDLFVLKERGNMAWKKVREGNEYNPNTVLRIFKEYFKKYLSTQHTATSNPI